MAADLRLLSYNVRSLRDDRAALVRVIRACAPDIVCLQEAPRFAGRRFHAARLARATGLAVVSAGRAARGTAVLARPALAVGTAATAGLPHTPGLHRRGLALAVLCPAPGVRLGVVSCHLGLRAAERRAHAPLVLAHLAALGAPAAVLAGDLNERPGGPAHRLLTAGSLRDARDAAPEGGGHTFPARAPDRRIDMVLTTAAVRVLGCGVPATGPDPADLRRATDHLPVLARLRL
ncbi:endonuclease/exonuclease/phosphatase family protein [Streptomyces sp. RFCAC02]|uniref:endonuclease/exonuclease/phosphatase family protein n=1 Tax=Streptomyces sp. RFCAC02 TaxID=2499143 RepID=UPI00101EDBDA|nr:endonuclease/exonuclease/phosphatase family protein [Streptomyces sp. RFCAC02]